jgi:hypothetical protein
MDYDRTCLVVWADWGSSGIWHPHRRGDQGPVRPVSYDDIDLPNDLAVRFRKWISWYDDFSPGRLDSFPWDAFHVEGACLANALAEVVGDRYSVEYRDWGEGVIVCTANDSAS